ncbi:MAG: hypothetical protein IPL84_14150 [Chitinophagaceae bacterium]|nr:hypothetical protein [Chitinophagaceae bacterium]
MCKQAVLYMALIGTFLASCNISAKRNTEIGTTRDSVFTGGTQADNTSRSMPEKSDAEMKRPVELQLFCNNEMAAYCVLLPLHEFKEDFTDETVVKAQHKFVPKQKKDDYTSIDVQGFNIDDENNYKEALFLNRDKNDFEESGLGIDTAYSDRSGHFYLIKGYLPNYRDKKFVQLSWVLTDRISINITYNKKEEERWMEIIMAMINRGPVYSN